MATDAISETPAAASDFRASRHPIIRRMAEMLDHPPEPVALDRFLTDVLRFVAEPERLKTIASYADPASGAVTYTFTVPQLRPETGDKA